MPAALLALLASASWGTSDFLGGLESRRSSPWGVAIVAQLIAAVGSVAVLASAPSSAPPTSVLLVWGLGGVASAVGVISGYHALALAKMSVVAPILAGAAAVPVLWGLAAGERPHAVQLAGVAITLLGVVLISRPASETPGERRPVDRTGVLLALVAAVGIGLMLVALGHGADGDRGWAVAVVRSTATLCVAVSIALTRPALHLRRRTAPLLLVVGLLIFVANVTFAAACTMADLSIVAVLGWLGPAVIVLWARVVLHERLRPAQWLAAMLVLVGVVCLALG